MDLLECIVFTFTSMHPYPSLSLSLTLVQPHTQLMEAYKTLEVEYKSSQTEAAENEKKLTRKMREMSEVQELTQQVLHPHHTPHTITGTPHTAHTHTHTHTHSWYTCSKQYPHMLSHLQLL